MVYNTELLVIDFFAAALLYSAVGHGGASAYLVLMALASFPPEVMRPVALWMNVAVSLLATLWFMRAGHFRWCLFWPFAVAAIPMAWFAHNLAIGVAGARIRAKDGDGSIGIPGANGGIHHQKAPPL